METGYTIRRATPADARAVTEVRIRTWQHNYRGLVPDDYLASLDIESESLKREQWMADSNKKSVTLVAQDPDNKIVGFTYNGAIRKTFKDFDGEIYAVYILPQHQGKGLGEALFSSSLSSLKANGFDSCLVWTLKNGQAVNFYKKMGGRFEGEDTIEIGKTLEIVAFGWDELS